MPKLPKCENEIRSLMQLYSMNTVMTLASREAIELVDENVLAV